MFNKNLRRIRLQKGLSQKQLADYLCISPQSVSKWEKGEALPSIEYLPILAECLGCDINAFFAPVQEISYDLELLKKTFWFLTDDLCRSGEMHVDFLSFKEEHPDMLNMFESFLDEMKRTQIVNSKTVQEILGCSEEDASFFIDCFECLEIAEKIDTGNSFFVVKSNVDGIVIYLRTEARGRPS